MTIDKHRANSSCRWYPPRPRIASRNSWDRVRAVPNFRSIPRDLIYPVPPRDLTDLTFYMNWSVNDPISFCYHACLCSLLNGIGASGKPRVDFAWAGWKVQQCAGRPALWRSEHVGALPSAGPRPGAGVKRKKRRSARVYRVDVVAPGPWLPSFRSDRLPPVERLGVSLNPCLSWVRKLLKPSTVTCVMWLHGMNAGLFLPRSQSRCRMRLVLACHELRCEDPCAARISRMSSDLPGFSHPSRASHGV